MRASLRQVGQLMTRRTRSGQSLVIIAFAAAVSRRAILACAWGERTSTAAVMPAALPSEA